jgi:molybdopterin-guanine dinucleotide biosynthesis protein A
MRIAALWISPGHNFFGHNGRTASQHATLGVQQAECVAGRGIRGDRFFDYRENYAGQIAFFEEAVHVALLRELRPTPRASSVYRRNVVVRDVNLMTLAGQEFEVQGVRFLGMGEAKPCRWMDEAAGAGAESWLAGRGGLRAKILSDGLLRVDSPPTVGLLLAGGQSRRMGSDKVTLGWRGQTLGAHQAATLAGSGAWPLYFSCRGDQRWTPDGFIRVEDRAEVRGALEALVNALTAAKAEAVTVLAVDLPLVRPAWLEQLAAMAREGGLSVVPTHDGFFEPLAACWHWSALPELQAALAAESSLQKVCQRLAAANLLRPLPLSSAEAEQLANLNTPEDLARLT